MKKISLPLILLLIATFLAPLLGGQLANEVQGLTPGFLVLLQSIFGGSDTPTLSHALVGLLPIVALAFTMFRRQVVQLPNIQLASTLLLFLSLLALSVGTSRFQSVSTITLAEWLLYGTTFFAVVGCSGRRDGPKAILIALFASVVFLGLWGVIEYQSAKLDDPTWRIMANSTPNALAGVYLIGLILGLGLTVTEGRLFALLAGSGCVVIGFALALTQSKGGFLAGLFGLLAFAIFLARLQSGIGFVRVGACLLAIVMLATALQLQQSRAAKPGIVAATALGRIGNMSETKEQSFTFRKLLWQGAGELVGKNPMGFGMGTYRYLSAKPGLTTQTQLAHDNFLQLAVEGGILAPAVFLLFLVMWLARVLRGFRSLPLNSAILLSAVIAAVAATMAHGLIESNLYYFSIGMCLFILLAVGIQFAPDANAPEYAPKQARYVGIGILGVIGVLALYSGWAEAIGARVRGEMNDPTSTARDGLESLKALAPRSGETWYLAALMAPTEEERTKDLQLAAELAPSTRNLRMLAREFDRTGQEAKALTSLDDALRDDPNNLPALLLKMQVQDRMATPESAVRTARQLIDVEKTPYFLVRSLPEVIPTETYDARLYLAAHAASSQEKVGLLKEATGGYLEYLRRTVPNVKRMSQLGPSVAFGGQTLAEAQAVMKRASAAARQLQTLDRRAGDPAGADEAAKAADAFDAAFAGSPNK